MRVMVKVLYEVESPGYKALRVLIYGTMDDGIGLAKNIRSQHPIKYDLRGFVSHDKNYTHYRIMGVKVYDENEQLEEVVEKNKIEAVIVSPQRANAFRRCEDSHGTGSEGSQYPRWRTND